MLCGLLDRGNSPADCIRFFREGRIDGVVYLPPNDPEMPWLEELRGEGIPTALCNGLDTGGEMDSVVVDYAHNIHQAALRLQENGFSNLLYVMPDEPERLCPGDRDRVRGFDGASAGLPAGSCGKVVFRLDCGVGERLARARSILAGCKKPAGIVACYWVHAYYLQMAAMESGLVPADFQIISGDCPIFTRDLYPRATGVGLPFEEVGRLSAGMLIDRLEGKTTQAQQIKIKNFSFIG